MSLPVPVTLRSPSITTGAGTDRVEIDNQSGALGSVFAGAFALNTGGGTDDLTINCGDGNGVTDFKGPVLVNLGAGDDLLGLALSGKVKFEAAAQLPVLFDGGTGTNTLSVTRGNLPDRVPTFLHFA